MKGKRFLALILAILMCVALLSSCGGSADDEAPPAPDDGGEVPEKQGEEEDTDQPEEPEGLSDEVITVALQAEPNSMVPDVVFLSNTIQIINRLIYEPLLYADYTTLEIDYDQGLITNVERLDDALEIVVMDDGVGMSEEQVEQIRDALENQEIGVVDKEGRISVGMKNVYDRIRLNCGPEYGFTVQSAPGLGTSVTFRLPVWKEL